jgi:hypothetical protein
MLVRIVMLAARSWLLRAYKRRRRLPEPRFYCPPADQAMDILKWHVRDQLTMGFTGDVSMQEWQALSGPG